MGGNGLKAQAKIWTGCWWLEPALTPINASMCDHMSALPPACSSMDDSGEKPFSLETQWCSVPITPLHAEVGDFDLTHTTSLDHLQKLSRGMFPACGSAEALQGRICSPLYICELNPHFESKDLLMAWVETAPLGCELSSRVKGLNVFQRFEGRGITTTKREPPCST